MPKVLMPIGDATETIDTFYPYFRLPEDGFEVVVAGPERASTTACFTRFHRNDPAWDITRESPGYHIRASVAFRDVDPRVCRPVCVRRKSSGVPAVRPPLA